MPEQITIDLTKAGQWEVNVESGLSGLLREDTIWVGKVISGAIQLLYHDWVRFLFPYTGAEIEITNAYLILTRKAGTGAPSGLEIHARVYLNDEDDAVDPTDGTDANAKVMTADYAPSGSDPTYFLNFGYPGTGDTPVYLAGLKDILTDVISRPGFVAGNSVAFYIKTVESTDWQVQASCYPLPGYTGDEPQLVVEYEWRTPVPPGADQHVEHTLNITQGIEYTLLNTNVESLVEFEQDIAWSITHNKSVESVITFDSRPHLVMTFERSLEHLLIVTSDVDYSVSRPKVVESVLVITQDIIRNAPLDKQIVHELVDLGQDIEWAYTYARTVEHTLDVTQDISQNAKNRHIIHVLRITQEIGLEAIVETIGVRNTLVIEQDISYNVNRTRAVESDLTIRQSVLGYTGNGVACARLDRAYRPYADASINFPEEPTLVRGDITLSYDSLELTLPAPLLGDHEELQITRVQRKTRGGVLKTYTDDSWVKVRTFRFKFEGLTTAKTLEVFEFFGATLGLNVHLIDHEGREWDGYIVNPQGEAAQFFRQCGNTTEFDFEGVLTEE